MSDVEERLANIIVTQFGADRDSITAATRFQEDLKADMFGITVLITTVEEEFDIEIADDKAEGLLTIGGLLEYLVRARSSSG